MRLTPAALLFTTIATASLAQPGEPAAPPAATPTPAGGAAAAATTTYSLELNKIEAVDNVCTGYFIFQNQSATVLSQARIQLFVFDAAGGIAGAFAIGFTDIRPMSEKVGVYELARPNCDGIGRILVNEVVDCQGPDAVPVPQCSAEFSATSRATVQLQY